MPCRSEYLEPNAREVETTKVARLLLYVLEALNPHYKASPILKHTVETAYPDTKLLDQYTENLCDLLKRLSEEQENRIIWDGRKREARELAEWWERHQEFDKKREYEKISRRDEHFMNNLIAYITTEKQLAEKHRRPMDRLKLHKYMTEGLE